MRLCHQCTLDFPDNRKFCEFCGSKLVDSVQIAGSSVLCPKCSESVQPDWKFCQNCRARLGSPSAPVRSEPIERVSVGTQTSSTAPPSSSPTVSLSTASQPTPTQRIVIRCRSCKNLVDEDSAFCEFCGANLTEDTPPSKAQTPPKSSNADDPIVESFARNIADGNVPIIPTEAQAQVQCADLVQSDETVSAGFTEPTVTHESGELATIVNEHAAIHTGELTEPAFVTEPSEDSLGEQGQLATEASSFGATDESGLYTEPGVFESNAQGRSQFRWLRAVIAAVVIIVVLAAAVGIGGWYWWSRRVPLARQPTSLKPAPATPAVPEGMVHVKGGAFLMGRDDGDEYERPAHQVTVTPFFIDKYEVTCEEYKKFVDATHHAVPSSWKEGLFPSGFEKIPVTGGTWDDANAYAEWAGKRLPTEEEWEFAARGVDGRRYSWGNEWQANATNSGDSSANKLVEVGSYPDGKSPSGAMDMLGNAWEWTASDLTAYPGGQLSSPPAKDVKVIRGGSWKEDKNQATTTYRGFLAARGAKDYSATGFRCVKDSRE